MMEIKIKIYACITLAIHDCVYACLLTNQKEAADNCDFDDWSINDRKRNRQLLV